MINSIKDYTVLNNGVKMPWLGLGVYMTNDGKEVIESIHHALDAGYRSIDTASFYKNETGVGEAVKQYDLPRNEIFITSKVWNADQGYESTLKAFEVSRKKLQLEYLDLYLIHWPVKGKYNDTWKAMIKLYNDGLVKAIGVSNFQIHHLADVTDTSGIVPMVNQVELHPMLNQKDLRAYCSENNIQIEAWTPIMKGKLDNPVLLELSNKYGKTPAQIVLRWDIQHKVVTIPKSVHKSRIIENANIFDFIITDEDMKRIDNININKRLGPDPDNFDF